MFDFKKKAPQVVVSPLVEVMSGYFEAFHILQGGDKNALCGYENWVPPVTLAEVTSESFIGYRNDGWHWCHECVSNAKLILASR